ncbi:MAG: lipoprotein [Pseudomonadota bacterium]
MRQAGVVVAAALLLAGCGQKAPEAGEASPPAPTTPVAPAPEEAPVQPLPPGSPGALPDDRTPVSEAPFTPESAQGAAQVVQTYFALLESGRAAEGRANWSDAAQADAFVAGLGEFRSFHALIGAPGEIEGAAGSLYVEVPVQLYGRLKDGGEGHRIGAATLRRVNNVPGASADQLRWSISGVALRPAP